MLVLEQKLESLQQQSEIDYRALVFCLVENPEDVAADKIELTVLRSRRTQEQLTKDVAMLAERKSASDKLEEHQRLKAEFEVARERWRATITTCDKEIQMAEARIAACLQVKHDTQMTLANMQNNVIGTHAAANAILYGRRSAATEQALRDVSQEIQTLEHFVSKNNFIAERTPSVAQRQMFVAMGQVDPLEKHPQTLLVDHLKREVAAGRTDLADTLAEAQETLDDLISLPERMAEVQEKRKAAWSRHAEIIASQGHSKNVDFGPGTPERA